MCYLHKVLYNLLPINLLIYHNFTSYRIVVIGTRSILVSTGKYTNSTPDQITLYFKN